MIKVLSSAILTVLVISGCGSSDSSSENDTENKSISIWEYFVPNTSKVLSFDIIKTEDSTVTSTEIGSYTHEYTVVGDNEVKGPFRTYDGEYLFENKDYIYYGAADENASGSYASGGIETKVDIGDYVYPDRGNSGWSNTSGGITYSVYTSGSDCIVSKMHTNITILDGYTYNDVLEVTCESKLTQTYTPTTISGIDTHKEYYQKDIGFIGKVNKDCIVSTADYGFEFIDDLNTTCIKTTTQYELFNNL